jgi:hypothetical protein
MDSNDINEINSRVINHTATLGGGISPAGRIMCNIHTMFLFELYNFAASLPSDMNEELVSILAKNEDIPKRVIELCNPKPVEEEEFIEEDGGDQRYPTTSDYVEDDNGFDCE